MDKNHSIKLLTPIIKVDAHERNNTFKAAKKIDLVGQFEAQNLTINDEQDIDYFSIQIALSNEDYQVTSTITQKMFDELVLVIYPAELTINLQEYYDASLTVGIYNEDKSLFKDISHAQRLSLSIKELIKLLPNGGAKSFYVVVKNTNFQQFGVLRYSIKFDFSHCQRRGSGKLYYDNRKKVDGQVINEPIPPIMAIGDPPIRFRDFPEMEKATMEALDGYLDELQIHSNTERQQAVAAVQLKLSQLALDANMHDESTRLLKANVFIHERLGEHQKVATIKKMIDRKFE